MDTAMHLALRADKIETVYLLLRNGANSKLAGSNKNTCVQCAKELGYYDLADTLQNFNAFDNNNLVTSPSYMYGN